MCGFKQQNKDGKTINISNKKVGGILKIQTFTNNTDNLWTTHHISKTTREIVNKQHFKKKNVDSVNKILFECKLAATWQATAPPLVRHVDHITHTRHTS